MLLAYSFSASVLCSLTVVEWFQMVGNLGPSLRSKEPVGILRYVLHIPPTRCRIRLRASVLKVRRASEQSLRDRCTVLRE